MFAKEPEDMNTTSICTMCTLTRCTANSSGRPAQNCSKEMTFVRSTSKTQHLKKRYTMPSMTSPRGSMGPKYGLWNFYSNTYLCRISLVASYAAMHSIVTHWCVYMYWEIGWCITEAEDDGEMTAWLVPVLLRVCGHLSPDSYQICVDCAITHNALN